MWHHLRSEAEGYEVMVIHRHESVAVIGQWGSHYEKMCTCRSGQRVWGIHMKRERNTVVFLRPEQHGIGPDRLTWA